MSDLRPTGAPVVIGGQEYNILFTIGAIETIQENCNKALVENNAGNCECSELQDRC